MLSWTANLVSHPCVCTHWAIFCFDFALSNICLIVPQKWGYQDTPAKELMKQRGASHTPDEPRLPAYLKQGRMPPSSAFMPLGRLQGQFYHVPTNVGLLRTWGHPGKPHYGHPPRFWNPSSKKTNKKPPHKHGLEPDWRISFQNDGLWGWAEIVQAQGTVTALRLFAL